MIERRSKKVFYFVVFILPCLILYSVFCIVPFSNGIIISLTNWDGLTPKTPISLEKKEFEAKILNNLKKEADKNYVLSVYALDSSGRSYHREAVKGLQRSKLEHIFRKTGYEPDFNKGVGLSNYAKIFSGNGGKDFYPHNRRIEKFTKTSSLPNSIAKKEFIYEVMRGAKQNEAYAKKLSEAYIYNREKEKYILAEAFDKKKAERAILAIPEIENKATNAAAEKFISALGAAGGDGNFRTFAALERTFVSENEISQASAKKIRAAVDQFAAIAALKNILAEVWVVTDFNMGVIGFTAFFALFSVIGINVFAFALALALDTGLRGQKILRTIFFLPNVLSMIIVALIWTMLFNQLLPAITGIDKWISDSHKAPWLLVAVSVWQGAGYYMIVYLAGLQNIPTDIIEAARIDGTTAWQQFKFITLPMMVPSMTISLFLTIANSLKSFDLIYAMTGPTGYATGTVPFVMDIYFDAFAKKQAGLATAKAMVLFAVIVLITGGQLYMMKRKEVEA